MWNLGHQITHAIDVVNIWDNPLVRVIATVKYRPNVIFIQSKNQSKVFAVSLEPMTAPNVVVRLRMAIGNEKIVESVLVQNERKVGEFFSYPCHLQKLTKDVDL